jgi:hypothetical protein
MTSARPVTSALAVLRTLTLVLTLGLLSSACAGDACDVGAEQYRTELYFGLDRANAEPVSEEEWKNFVDTKVTPRFTEGLTMFDAHGQYQMADGTVVKENSKVIVLLHQGQVATSRTIDTIREEYKSQFSQEAVLRIDSLSCVDF